MVSLWTIQHLCTIQQDHREYYQKNKESKWFIHQEMSKTLSKSDQSAWLKNMLQTNCTLNPLKKQFKNKNKNKKPQCKIKQMKTLKKLLIRII
jgi:hypothetical protein